MAEVEKTNRTLNHFAFLSFKDTYWSLPPSERSALFEGWLAGLRASAPKVNLYQVFPADGRIDLLVWSALPIEQGCDTGRFFEAYARSTNPLRRYLEVSAVLWGYNHPSQYSRAQRSEQEIDPFAREHKPYLIVYPFVKTAAWYLLGRDARQGMMNEHIRIGKQYTDISQLLLYSFGLQDQEFIVVYETDNLARFSDLVGELRNTDSRSYTLRDTPIYTAVYHPAEETLALWK
ncbi:MAG: chlorite dismutase family protein [Chloroflexi bacterium]|nr:chlorite dismutase family protein [Chloroflexota bacterium]